MIEETIKVNSETTTTPPWIYGIISSMDKFLEVSKEA